MFIKSALINAKTQNFFFVLACEQAFGRAGNPSLSLLFFPQTESLFTGHFILLIWSVLKISPNVVEEFLSWTKTIRG